MGRLLMLDIVPNCYTNENGDKIYKLLWKSFKSNDSVTLSFEGIQSVSTSFVNSAFLPLLQDFSFEFIKTHLKIVRSNSHINELIVRRLKDEEALAQSC